MAYFPYTYHYSYKPLQLQQTQLHLSSFIHCKCSSSSLSSFQFHDSPPSKHPLVTEANARVAPRSNTALSGDIAEKLSTNAVDSAPNADILSGLSSFSHTSKRDVRKSPETDHIDAEKRVERRVILKDRYSKAKVNSKRRKDVCSGSGASPARFKSEKLVRNSEKTRTLRVSNEGVGKFGGNVEQKEKRIKKSKDGQPGTTLRLGLDMCSKRGDVVSAIKLYDLARKEGIKLGQYHYAVLLYLCSSAAAGVVQPAKSGSRTRSLSSGDGESSDLGSESLNEIAEIVKKSYVVEHSGKIKVDVGDGVRSSGLSDGEVDFRSSVNGAVDISELSFEGFVQSMKKAADNSNSRIIGSEGIQVSKDLKKAALQKGFEIYNEMRLEEVPMNEATFTSIARLAMALGDGEMAFDIVKQMKEYGINPRLRSYGPALAIFCSYGDVENAFKVEKNMLENGVYPEEPELEALLRVSIEAGKGDRVYYIMHKLRASVRQVSPSTADYIEKWFKSKVASRVGKKKWDHELIIRAMENGGGGWHGNGWLGKGKWTVSRTHVDSDGICKCCGEKLVTIDLDPIETENFAKSVASIAAQREKNLSFEKFQKWLDYYGPFEAVVDAANVGLYSQRKFKPSKVNLVVNGIRQMLPSKKWPLIVLHNRRITGDKMDEPFNRSLIEKWKNADALYATPTGSNDDWYWLYAAIKCRCLIVTNDEMRDHLFQVLGNDFFPKWKERHQVHFSFTETGPAFRMPPPCSVVIQETEKGHWHVPIASEVENEDERIWLCCYRGNLSFTGQDSSDIPKEEEEEAHISHQKKREIRNLVAPLLDRKHGRSHQVQESSSNTEAVVSTSQLMNRASILAQLESAEQRGACLIDFQI